MVKSSFAVRTAAAALAVAALTACQPPGQNSGPVIGPAVGEVSPALGLAVAPEGKMSGYSREKFPHWATRRDVGASCDVRDVVLRRDGDSVTGGRCGTERGEWFSIYDDRTLTLSSQVDIDHVVPLAEAWRSGASTWTEARRAEFANDLVAPQLIAVSAASNRSKGDQDPARWMPPVRRPWCTYARDWVQVKQTYGLAADQAEADKLTEILRGCKG